MKAAIYQRFGPPDVIQIMETEKPIPKDDEVLINVRAASVNPYDWHFLRGTPYFLRIVAGLRRPRDTRFGVDVAGLVESPHTKPRGRRFDQASQDRKRTRLNSSHVSNSYSRFRLEKKKQLHLPSIFPPLT